MSLLENLLSQGAIERLGWMLVHFLWQGTAVALLLAVLLRLLRRSSANLRYAVACGAMALIAVLPLITIQLVEVAGPAAEAGPPPETSLPARAAPTPVAVQMVDESPPPMSAPQPEEADLTTPISWQERAAATLEPALPYLVLGWLAGVFGLSAWHLGGWTQLQRLKRRMAHKAGAPLHATLDELAAKLGVRRAVTLLESALVEVPTVVGWLRPVILLPTSALIGLSPDQLRAILAHELAHIRRYDYLANILQTVVEILGFYHPGVWWVSNRIRIERENCCDDLAVGICGSSLQYARALTSMEEIRHSRTDLAMAATGGSLMARVARLLGRPAVDDRRFAWLPGLITLLLVIGAVIPTAFALAHSAPRPPESPSDDVSALVDKTRDTADSNGSPQTQIAIRLVLAEVFCDAVLDPQTAAEAAGLLARLAGDGGVHQLGTGSIAPPTIEELQQPLVDVFSLFAPAPGRGNELVDLLGRKGYAARKLSSPQVQILSGEPTPFTIGDIPTANTPPSEDSEFGFIQYTVTATEVRDQNAIRMDIDAVRTYLAHKRDDPGSETTTWTLDTAVLAPNNQWMPITENGLKRLDWSGRECLQLPLVLATIVDKPEPEATGNGTTSGMRPRASPDQIVDLKPGMGGISPMSLADEPARTQVLLTFTIIDVFADRVLDGDTAVRARDLLTLIRPADANWPITPTKQPTLDELRSPLREVFARFEPILLKSKELTDLLVSRGYAEVTSTPRLLTAADTPASIMIGQEKDPNAPGSQSAGVYLKMTVVPHLLEDQNATRLQVTYEDQRAAGDPDDPNGLVSTRQVASTLVLPNDRHIAIVVGAIRAPHVPLRILLIGPIGVIAPPPTTAAAAGATIESPVPSSTEQREETPILINFKILKALTGVVMDRETMLLAAEILAAENPQALNEIAHTDPQQSVTQGQFLRTWVAGRHLSSQTLEILLDVLQSRGYLDGEATPEVLVYNNRQARLHVGTVEPLLPPADPASPSKTIQLGTSMQVTPHIASPTSDRITMEIAIEWKERVKQDDPNNAPTIRSIEMATTVTTPRNRYFTLMMEPDNIGNAGATDAEFLLVIFRGDILKTAAEQETASVPQARSNDGGPRQVLLNIRVVAIERSDLLNLGVEWAYPTIQSGRSNDDNDWLNCVVIGYSPDSAFTTVLMARLNQLEASNQAQIVANPQLTALDGHQARLRSVREEWFLVGGSMTGNPSELYRAESGTVLSVTPHIGAGDQITLEIETQASDARPRNSGSDLPVVTRRMAKNAVTVQNGGTVAVAGLSENSVGRNDRSGKTVAVFVTATLIPETERVPQSRRMIPPAQTADARRAFVNSDPTVRELSENVATIERDLIVSRRTLTANHPTVVQKKDLLKAFQSRLQERRTELEQEFDAGLTRRLEEPGSRVAGFPVASARSTEQYLNRL